MVFIKPSPQISFTSIDFEPSSTISRILFLENVFKNDYNGSPYGSIFKDNSIILSELLKLHFGTISLVIHLNNEHL